MTYTLTEIRRFVDELRKVETAETTEEEIVLQMPMITQERIDRIVRKYADLVVSAQADPRPTHLKLLDNLIDFFEDDDYQDLAVSFAVARLRLLPDPIEEVGLDAVYDAMQAGVGEALRFVRRQADDS